MDVDFSEGTALYPGIVDSHFHSLEMTRKGLPVEELLRTCARGGMSRALDAGIVPGDLEERRRILASFPWVRLASGISPASADADDSGPLLALLEEQLRTGSVWAVGECGLDRHWNYGAPGRQEELFRAQIRLADRYRLPLIIHNRDADGELLREIEAIRPARGGVMHCFSSDSKTALRAVDLGFFLSFAGNVTFRSASALREAAGAIPLDRLLIETDSPYLSPEPLRGRPNHPGRVGHVAACIASVRGITPQEVTEAVRENFDALFGPTADGEA